VDIVLNNVDAETDIGVVADLVGRVSTLGGFIGLLHSALDTYGDPSKRDASWAKAAKRLRELIDASEPGSDFQLAWVRGLIVAARSDDDVRFVRGLLDGTTKIDGIEVDTDLRWQITSALAAFGAIDEKAIQAELERDPTDEGERWAANARAGLPNIATKNEEWEHVTKSPDVSLATLRTLALGFNRSFQPGLLEQFSDRYFAEVVPFWERRELDL